MNRSFRKQLAVRSMAVILIVGVIAAALIVRLVYWQLLDGGNLSRSALAEQFALTRPARALWSRDRGCPVPAP